MKLTTKRKEIFLETYSRTGSFPAAARAASPHASTRWGASRTFRDEMRRNPEFATEVEEARERALGLAEQTIFERGVEGVEEAVWSGGKVVGTRKIYDNRLLLRFSEKLDPSWAQRHHQKLEHSGKLQHEHRGVMLEISAADVLLLEADKQRQLVALVEEMGKLKGNEQDGSED